MTPVATETEAAAPWWGRGFCFAASGGGLIPRGAISGVMGAYILLYPHARVRTWFPPIFLFNIRAMFFLAYWFALQLLMAYLEFGAEAGEQGGVAVWAHVGGFVAGLALVKVFENHTLTRARRAKVQLTRAEVAQARPWM